MDTERFLRTACEGAGVEFAWGVRVTGVRVAPTEVVLTGEDGRVWTGTHAVAAADGARSAVRGELGIPMEGPRADGFHVVVDVADLPGAELPLERVFHYEHPGVGGRSVMRVPFTGGFQVDLQCRDDDAQETYGTEEAVREWLPAVVGDGYAERILWVSTYRFLRKVAVSFSDPHRRVLLVGEAAHLFPPFGARGMNSGIADAAAAARAIADGTAEAVAGFAEVRRAAGRVQQRGCRQRAGPSATAPPDRPRQAAGGCGARARAAVVRFLAGARAVRATERFARCRGSQVLRPRGVRSDTTGHRGGVVGVGARPWADLRSGPRYVAGRPAARRGLVAAARRPDARLRPAPGTLPAGLRRLRRPTAGPARRVLAGHDGRAAAHRGVVPPVELASGSMELRLLLRHAPPLGTGVRVWAAGQSDPRTVPAARGPTWTPWPG